MILALFLPSGECHINSYRLSNGNYRSVCGVTVEKVSGTQTLTADDSFPGICRVCKEYYDEVYNEDLNKHTSYARSITNTKLQSTLDHHRANFAGPEADYYGVEDRIWWRLSKYKKAIPKPNVKPKKNKYKFKFRK